MDRRDFLRLAGGGAAVAVAGAGCRSGRSGPHTALATREAKGRRTLRLALWSHYIQGYDNWFDNEFAQRWGEKHDVDVIVDHIPYAELPARAATEVAAGRGHDLIAFITAPPVFEDDVIDHREIVEEVTAKLGPMAPIVERNVFNPKTNKYFGFAEYWVANPVHYRVNLWDRLQPGFVPSTWDDVLRAAPRLKAMGHPVGIALSEDDDSGFSLFGLLGAFGAQLQDEEGHLTLASPETVEAVKLGAELYRAGMTDEVFFWNSSANNRLLATGVASLIINAISGVRITEDQDPDLAADIALAPPPAGPAARVGVNSVVNAFVIWRFAANQEDAKQFLIDLALAGRESFLRSKFYNLPAFPRSVPDLAELVGRDETSRPADKYRLLADAESWSTNIGDPGHHNAAVDEVFFQFIVPRMFAAAARGDLTAEAAVEQAAAQAAPIFDKWRELGKI